MFEFAYRDGGDCVIPIKYLPADTGKTFLKGETVNVESGLLDNGAAADTAFAGIVNAPCGPTSASDPVEVILALSDVVFRADYISSVPTKTSVVDADLGTAFDLGAAAQSVNIDLDDTTGGAWVCVGYDNANKKIYVKCLASKRSAVAG